MSFSSSPSAVTGRRYWHPATFCTVGIGYAFNIVGMILGAVIGSFILLPLLGVETLSYVLEISLCCLTVGILLKKRANLQTMVSIVSIAVVILILIPEFNWPLLSQGYYYNAIGRSLSGTC